MPPRRVRAGENDVAGTDSCTPASPDTRPRIGLDDLPLEVLSVIARIWVNNYVDQWNTWGDYGLDKLAFLSKRWNTAAMPVINSFFATTHQDRVLRDLPKLMRHPIRRAQLKCVEITYNEEIADEEDAARVEARLTGQVLTTLTAYIGSDIFPHLTDIRLSLMEATGLWDVDGAEVVEGIIAGASQVRTLHLQLWGMSRSKGTWARTVAALRSSPSAQRIRSLMLNLGQLRDNMVEHPIPAPETACLPNLQELATSHIAPSRLSMALFPAVTRFEFRAEASLQTFEETKLLALLQSYAPQLLSLELGWCRPSPVMTQLLAQLLPVCKTLHCLSVSGLIWDEAVISAIPSGIQDLELYGHNDFGDNDTHTAPTHALVMRLVTDWTRLRRLAVYRESFEGSLDTIRTFCDSRNITCWVS